MDYETLELRNYLVNHKSLINQISNQRIWVYKFAILIKVCAIFLIFKYQMYEYSTINNLFILTSTIFFKHFEGLFKKVFADKYELRKYKTALDYSFYNPKKYATISRFKKFVGNRSIIIVFGGIFLYLAIFWNERESPNYLGKVPLIFLCSVLISYIDQYINIIKEILVSRKFKKLLISGSDETSVALEIINQEKFNKNNEHTSYDEYEQLVKDYKKDLSPSDKAELFMKPIIPKKNKI